jgi:hypothetical protein
MASPTNWLIFYCIFLAAIGVVTLLVIRAANNQNKGETPDAHKPQGFKFSSDPEPGVDSLCLSPN